MPDSSNLDILSADDTIAAIATAPGVGAIGIVRVSGPESLAVAQKCFRSKRRSAGNLPDRQLTHGRWVHPDSGESVDEVLVAVMRAPHSYTGEDVLEVHGHGGPVVLQQVLSATLAAGARPARPGEFTLRAFRGGRMDLLQAEAVADLVAAETEAARRLALRALRGGLSERVARMKDEVLELLAHLETHLEFPLEDVEPMPERELVGRMDALRKEVERLVQMGQRRGSYRRGLFTVITGRPNVGKSLLFNRVVGRRRALVTEHPGTTRDTIEETVRLGSVELHLVDTAGGREAGEEIEWLGVRRAVDAARQADLLWFLIDAQEGVTREDELWLERIVEQREARRTGFCLVVNKMDLVKRAPEISSPLFRGVFPEEKRSWISAKTGDGLEAFLAEVEGHCTETGHAGFESELLVNQRHEQLLKGMLEAFQRIEGAVREGLCLDVVAADLWDIKGTLDRLDGTRASSDVLTEIFSRFCIGK